jgi:tRNA-splicing ligase RtcB (3'-phosphate/5'-hydroxy nucleic acid ligase)
MTTTNYEVWVKEKSFPVKSWTKGVTFDDHAKAQLANIATLPFIHKHIAVLPDVHAGIGATVGSVIPTLGAIIPAAVGVDIGCGMMAIRTSLRAEQLPDNLKDIRVAIEAAVPHGRSDNGGSNDRGAWGNPPEAVEGAWASLESSFRKIVDKNGKVSHRRPHCQLGTLGGGNHFIELCIDEEGFVWVMLHSGSRGVGNAIGSYFIEQAKKEMQRWFINLPDMNLAYLAEGSRYFNDYVEAVEWAQQYALVNRKLMMEAVLRVLASSKQIPEFTVTDEAVNCHHNYIAKENHYHQDVWVTRKGAIRARKKDLGIIPGSMGERSFIVRGKGNSESFCSASHGAGRVMSRTEARNKFTVKDHEEATKGVECRKDKEVIDEIPMAYKDIDAVMKAQEDLVEIVHQLKQVVCVKG